MNNIKIKLRCSYCNDIIKFYVEPFDDKDNRLVNLLIKDNTLLCKKCTNNEKARKWLGNRIMNR